jgi:hypothetical protein
MLDKLKNQELSIFEIMGMAFSVFKENILSFFAIALIIGIPINFIFAFVSSKFEAVTMSVDFVNMLKNAQLIENFISTGKFKDVMLCETVLLILNGLFYPLITLAVAHMTEDILEGRKADIKKSILAAFEKGPVLIPAAILYQIIIWGGFMLFVIPALVFTVWFYFYKYAIILDNETPVESLRLSRNISRGNFARVAVSLLALYILEYALAGVFSNIFMSFGINVSMEFISSCIKNLIDTFFWCASAMLYLNLKYVKSK